MLGPSRLLGDDALELVEAITKSFGVEKTILVRWLRRPDAAKLLGPY